MKKKSFKELFDQVKKRDTYWTASLILDFTEGLHKIMEANRVTRSDLARRLGVSPAYVTKVLRGNVNPSASQHQRWGLPSTQAQTEGLRVDPERRVKHCLKAKSWRRRRIDFTVDSMVRLIRAAGGEVTIQVAPKSHTKAKRNNLYKKQWMEKAA